MAASTERQAALESMSGVETDDRGPRRKAGLIYLSLFGGWILLVAPVLFVLSDNRFVRFHAVQSLLLAFVALAVQITAIVVLLEGVAEVLSFIPPGLFFLPLVVAAFAPLGYYLWYAYRAYRGEAAWFPGIGTVANWLA